MKVREPWHVWHAREHPGHTTTVGVGRAARCLACGEEDPASRLLLARPPETARERVAAIIQDAIERGVVHLPPGGFRG